MAYRKVGVSQALIEQNPTTEALTPPTSVSVYLSDKVTLAPIYSDESGTSLANPVPTGVTLGAAGLDTAGNLNVWLDLGSTYWVLVDGSFILLSVVPAHGADFREHADGTVPDPHGDRAWAAQTFISQTDTATFAKLAGDAGLVRF